MLAFQVVSNDLDYHNDGGSLIACDSQLQESCDSMHPVCHHVRRRAVVERILYYDQSRVGEGYSAAGQSGSPGKNGLLPNNQPRSPLNGVEPHSSNCAAGEQAVVLWTVATSQPLGDQTWEVVEAPTGIRRWLTNRLVHSRQTESTVLLEEPETRDPELLQEK